MPEFDPPTLSYGGTSLVLPYPRDAVPVPVLARASRRSLGGSLGVQITATWWTYRLAFVRKPFTTYEAIRALYLSAVAAGELPLFASAVLTTTGAGVRVEVSLGDFSIWQPNPSLGDFTLTLEEALPR